MAGASVFHHHCESAWERTELQGVYRNTGMMEVDWAMGVYVDTRVAEMDAVTGSTYSENPRVCSLHCILYNISSHLTIQRIRLSIFQIF